MQEEYGRAGWKVWNGVRARGREEGFVQRYTALALSLLFAIFFLLCTLSSFIMRWQLDS